MVLCQRMSAVRINAMARYLGVLVGPAVGGAIMLTLGPSHGYTIAARIEQVSAGRVQLNMGSLYPGLMRLEQRGAIRASWGTTENRRNGSQCDTTAKPASAGEWNF